MLSLSSFSFFQELRIEHSILYLNTQISENYFRIITEKDSKVSNKVTFSIIEEFSNKQITEM